MSRDTPSPRDEEPGQVEVPGEEVPDELPPAVEDAGAEHMEEAEEPDESPEPSGEWSYRDFSELQARYDGLTALYAFKNAWATRRRELEPEGRRENYRLPFQRDRDRIVHSRAFRRLKHKTQVYVSTGGDHYRTRLTHTLEVSQLARTIGRALGLNEDLVEAVALAHDMGHTPFGHSGEKVLRRIMSGEDHLDGMVRSEVRFKLGGFKHNYQSLRVIDQLEARYDRPGLNLTDQVREGVLKHTGYHRDRVLCDVRTEGIPLERGPHLEGQAVAAADEIAQQTHDLEDGLRERQVDLERVEELAISQSVIHNIPDYRNQSRLLRQNKLIRGLIHLLVTGTIVSGLRRIGGWAEAAGIEEPEDFRGAYEEMPHGLIGLDEGLKGEYRQLRRFVYDNIINCYNVSRMDGKAVFLLRKLFKAYLNRPLQLPDYVLIGFARREKIRFMRDLPLSRMEEEASRYAVNPAFYRTVCDFIAGMTDKFAFEEYEKLYIPGEQI
ncbi:MAG: dNTP triphosphohydrolase [bacterium]